MRTRTKCILVATYAPLVLQFSKKKWAKDHAKLIRRVDKHRVKAIAIYDVEKP